MTNEEAIKRLKEIHDVDLLNIESWAINPYLQALEVAVSSIEKQIPKKPIEAKNLYPPEQFECPVCGGCVGRHKTVRKINDVWGETLVDCKVEYDYCLECGQKIDWSEYND